MVSYLLLLLIPLFYTNRFTITLSPIIILILILCLLKDEIKTLDFNLILTNKSILEYSYQAFLLAIITQAISNVIFKPGPNDAMIAMFQIPIISVYTVFFAPILEETVFRKIIYGEIQKRWNNKFSLAASIISSSVFALCHFNLYGFIGYFMVGMVFCYFYYKTKSIYTTILAHTHLNFLVVVAQSIIHT